MWVYWLFVSMCGHVIDWRSVQGTLASWPITTWLDYACKSKELLLLQPTLCEYLKNKVESFYIQYVYMHIGNLIISTFQHNLIREVSM